MIQAAQSNRGTTTMSGDKWSAWSVMTLALTSNDIIWVSPEVAYTVGEMGLDCASRWVNWVSRLIRRLRSHSGTETVVGISQKSQSQPQYARQGCTCWLYSGRVHRVPHFGAIPRVSMESGDNPRSNTPSNWATQFNRVPPILSIYIYIHTLIHICTHTYCPYLHAYVYTCVCIYIYARGPRFPQSILALIDPYVKNHCFATAKCWFCTFFFFFI